MLELTEKQEKRLLDFVLKRFKKMRDYRDQWDTKIQKWLDIYNAVTFPKKYSWMSNLFIPYVYSLMQSIIPKLNASLFGSTDTILLKSKVPEYYSSERKVGKYGEQKLTQAGFVKKRRELLLASLKYPYAVAKWRWKFEVGEYTQMEHPKLFGIPIKMLPPRKVEKTKVIYDDPEMEFVEWENFWIDPDATNVKNARDLCHRSVKDWNFIKQLEEDDIFKNVDKLKDATLPKDLTHLVRGESGTDSEEYYGSGDKGYTEVELMEYWGIFDPFDDGEMMDLVVTLGNRNTILNARKNGNYAKMKPFKLFRAMPEDNRLEGKTAIELVEHLQNELNSKRNARMDNIKLSMRKTFKVLRDTDVDLKALFSGPGATVFVDDMNDVQEMIFTDYTGKLTEDEGIIKNDMQQVLGTTDYNMGTSAGRGITDTATGIAIITGEASSRFREMVVNLGEDFKEFIDMMYMQLKQYKTDDEVIQLYERGERKWDTISLEELHADYFMELNIKSITVNEEMEQSVWTNLLNVLGQAPFINQRALARTVLEKFKSRNIDEIMNVQQGMQELQGQGIQPPVAPAGEIPAGEMTPEERIAGAGNVNTIGSPLNPQFKEPVQALTPLQQLKQ